MGAIEHDLRQDSMLCDIPCNIVFCIPISLTIYQLQLSEN